MNELLYFDDLEVGQVFHSLGRTVTETDVVNFAGLTGDYTSLHVDHAYAANTPFRKPIAHGLLGLSMLAGLSSRCPSVATAAFVSVREWKFQRPIFFGDTVHAVTEVLEKRQHGRRRGEIIWSRQLVNQDGQVVQSGIFETLVDIAQPAERNKPRETETPATIPHPMKKAA